MKLLRIILLAVIAMLNGVIVQAQSQNADDIINKNIEAVGGKEKISAIKTVYTEYDMDVMGNQASGVSYIVNGKGYKSEIDLGGQKIVQVITDKGGWGINPLAGQTAPEDLPEEQVKASQVQLQVGGPLFNYVEKGNSAELQGRENMGDVQTYKIKLTTKEGLEFTYFLDPDTYYILKTIVKANVNGQDVETTYEFNNYKKTDYGFVMPENIALTLPQGASINIINKKIEINKDIDIKIFDKD